MVVLVKYWKNKHTLSNVDLDLNVEYLTKNKIVPEP